MLMLCLVFAVAGPVMPGAGDVSPMDPTMAYGAAPTMLVFAPDGGAGFDLMGQDSFDQILTSWNTTIAGPLGTSGAQNVNPPVPKCPMAVRATPWGRNGWQLGRTIDVPLGGTISRYASKSGSTVVCFMFWQPDPLHAPSRSAR